MMKLFKRFTNKGKCKSLLMRVQNEIEYQMYCMTNINVEMGKKESTARFKIWRRMRWYRDQLR